MREQRVRQRQMMLSRRQFLKVFGGSVAALGAAHAAPPTDSTRSGHFGAMFQGPPFAPPTDDVRAALLELGAPGGVMDAKDDLAAGPVALIVNPGHNPDSPIHTAGATFMGQFLDHDITFDTTSRLGQPTAPVTATNARTPALDLDSVYGDGPLVAPHLYNPGDRVKFRVESGGLFEDLPRYPGHHAAIIADARNDENLMIASLHAAFLLFHNATVDLVRLRTPSVADDQVFAEARRLTTWHYQWMILHEFLPLFVGQAMVDAILTQGRRFYVPRKGEAFIPVEFQIAYRFGHSMVRPSYRANLAGDGGNPFFGLVFDPSQENKPDPDDLRGGVRAPRRFIGWQTFFDFRDGQVKPNKLIDTKLSTPLFNLPLPAIPTGSPPTSLPQRTLLRHLTWQLPSGQALAKAMGAPVLSSADLAELRPIRASFVTATPLWYYILKEAEVMEGGLHLGPVGGRIVGEVIIGLLQTDPNAYVNVQPHFTPTIPTATGHPEDCHMVDFLTFAGVAPIRRGQ